MYVDGRGELRTKPPFLGCELGLFHAVRVQVMVRGEDES